MKKKVEHPCSVHVYHNQKEVRLPFDDGAIHAVVHAVLLHQNAQADFVFVHFITDAAMRKYHKKFFHDSSLTDCMSFPIDQSDACGPKVLGDVFVCPKTALVYAHNKNIPFLQELSLYVVHGVLHLLGYEDETPEARRVMKKEERSIMAQLIQ